MTAVDAETAAPSSFCGRGIGQFPSLSGQTARQIRADVLDQSKHFQNGGAQQITNRKKKYIYKKKGEHALRSEVCDQYEMT